VVNHPGALAATVLAMSALIAWLADTNSVWHFLKVFAVSALALTASMGLAAVFGKTLGDFLRNVNG